MAFLFLACVHIVVLSKYQDASLITYILSDAALSFADKAGFLMHIIFSMPVQTYTDLVLLIAFSLLSALNIVLFVFFLRRRISAAPTLRITSLSTGVGFFASILGIGCAACGSLVISALAASFGGVGFLTLLPLNGKEFLLFGIVFLLLSIVLLDRAIRNPLVCRVR
jgi:hypothetical protein